MFSADFELQREDLQSIREDALTDERKAKVKAMGQKWYSAYERLAYAADYLDALMAREESEED